jgi:uncharacterized protein (TIGR03086 family)
MAPDGMALELPKLHEQALASTRRYVANIKPDQMSNPTPCAEYDVRTLLNHIVGGNLWVAPLVGGQTIAQVGDRYDGDVLGDDPVASYDASATSAADAFNAPGAMAAPAAVSYGPVPGEIYAGHRFIDVLIHGWDLAKATGQDTTLAPELVVACRQVVEPQMDLLAGSGMFGTQQPVGADADAQTQLLATLGRRP